MQITVRPYGDDQLVIDPVRVQSRSGAEELAKQILAAADIVWPKDKPKETGK